MEKPYLSLAFVFFSLVVLPESFAQRNSRAIEKDTIVYIFCSSMPEDIDGRATYDAAQLNLQNVIQKESKRYTIEPKQLIDKDFNLVELNNCIEALRLRGKHTRVLFHFFDHGQNTGGKLPTLRSRFVPSDDGGPGPGLIDIQKNVIDPLLSSANLGFFLVFVDACNEVIPQGSDNPRPLGNPIPSQGLSTEAMLEKLEPSRSAAREALKTTKVSKEYKNEPLGLLLSSNGWLAVSSASPDQKAVVPKNTGGTGSLFFMDMLVNNTAVNDNWITFLDAYRQAMENNTDKKRKQTPIWMGMINGKPMAEEELLNPLRVLGDDEAQALIKDQHGDITLKTMKDYATGIVFQFCNLLDKTHDGQPLGKDITDISINPAKKVTIYDDLSVPMNRSANTKYVTLQQYRSRRGLYKSLYIEDSLKLDRVYEDTRRKGVMYIGFYAGKNITGPGKIDTVVRQRIFVEVQQESDPNLWQKAGNLFKKVGRFLRIVKVETEKSPVLVQKIWNIPGTLGVPKPPPPDTPIIIVPETIFVIVPPISPEDYYQNNAHKLIKELYSLIEQAANYDKESVRSREDIARMAKGLFFNPKSDTFQVSTLSKSKKTLSPDAYFERFWTEFDGFQYDSVKYTSIGWVSLTPDNSNPEGYLKKIDPDKWQAQIQYDQIFEGLRKKKLVYSDITTKKATIWLVRKPVSADSPSPFELRIGSISVISTRPLSRK